MEREFADEVWQIRPDLGQSEHRMDPFFPRTDAKSLGHYHSLFHSWIPGECLISLANLPISDIWSKLTIYPKFHLWLYGHFGYLVNFRRTKPLTLYPKLGVYSDKGQSHRSSVVQVTCRGQLKAYPIGASSPARLRGFREILQCLSDIMTIT